MDFKHLKNSITVNRNEKPNIYTAMCMVESLFKDFKEEAGVDLSQQPVGSDNLPTEMVVICRTLRKIYNAKNDQLVRSRKMLDDMMVSISQAEKALEESSSVGTELSRLQTRHNDLQTKLDRALRDKADCDSIAAACTELEGELNELRQYDPQSFLAKQSALEAERTQLRSQIGQNLKTMDALRAELQQANADLAQANADLEAGRSRLAECTRQRDRLQQEDTALRAEYSRLSGEAGALEQQCAEDRAQVESAGTRIRQLEQSIQTCRSTELTPAQERIDALRQELERMTSQREAGTRELVDLEQRSAGLEAELRSLQQTIQIRLTELDSAEAQAETLRAQKADAESQVTAAQSELSKLQIELTPAQERAAILHRELDRMTSLREAGSRELTNLEQQKAELVTELRSMHQTILAQRAELESGETQAEALRAQKADSENKLAAGQARLQAMGTELLRVQSELSVLQDSKLPEAEALLTATLERRDKLGARHTALTEQFDRTREEIRVLNEQLPEAEKELAARTAERNTLTARITIYKDELGDLTSRSEQLRQELTEVRAKADEMEQTQLPQALALLQTQQERRMALELKQADLSKAAEQAEQGIAALNASIPQAEQELARRNALCSSLQVQLESRTRELKNGEDRLTQLEESLTAAQADISAMGSLRIPQALDALQAAEEQRRALESQLTDLQIQAQESRDSIQDLNNLIPQARDELAKTEAECRALEASRDELLARQESGAKQLSELREELAKAEAACALLEQTDLPDCAASLRASTEHKEKLEADFTRCREEYSKTTQAIQELKLLIPQAEQEQLRQQAAQAALQARLDAEQARLESNRTQLAQLRQSIDEARTACAALEQEQLPAADKDLREKEQQRKELSDSLTACDARIQKLDAAIAELNAQIPGAEKELAALQASHTARTGQYKTISDEIARLEQHLQELNAQSDREKLAKYREQLNKDIEAAEERERQCAELEEEIRQAKEALRTTEASVQSLKQEKRQYESAREKTQSVLADLQSVTTPQFVRQSRQLQSRLQLLNGLCGRLQDSLDAMSRALGRTPVRTTLANDTSAILKALSQHADELQGRLTQCAESLELEEH